MANKYPVVLLNRDFVGKVCDRLFPQLDASGVGPNALKAVAFVLGTALADVAKGEAMTWIEEEKEEGQ